MPETPDEIYERMRSQWPGGPEDYDKRYGAAMGRAPVEAPAPQIIQDDIPDDEYGDVNPQFAILDERARSIDIIDAYVKWCGKMVPEPGNKRESIMISCPNPEHPDKNPSAYINLDKQVYHCAACNQGGDAFDIAAYHFGFPVPEYRQRGNSDFHQVKRLMVEDYFGETFKKSLGGEMYLERTSDEPPDPHPTEIQPELPAAPPVEVPVSENPTPDVQIGIEEPLDAPTASTNNPYGKEIFVDWEEIVPPDTFLDEWMTSVAISDVPHEYFFFEGLQALAFAVGDQCLLADERYVKPNLYVCNYGGTGSGKTKATYPYIDLLKAALPYKDDPYAACSGTKILSSSGSPEAMLDEFRHDLLDSENKVIGQSPVRGLIKMDELSSFIARASRPGSSFKEILIELYDVLHGNITHRTRGSGLTVAKDPFAQMITTTQPSAIHAFLRRTDAESGFLNRWLFAAGFRRQELSAYGGRAYDLTGSEAMLRSIHTWSLAHERIMWLKDDALREWEQFFKAEIAPLKDKVDLDSMFSRIDLTLKKFMILFAVNEKVDHPTVDHVRMAVSLYPYISMVFSQFSRDMGVTEDTDCQTRILEIIERVTKIEGILPPSKRDIIKYMNGRFGLDIVQKNLKIMTEMETVKETKHQGARGPITWRYSLATD